jgi:hypothetical protein
MDVESKLNALSYEDLKALHESLTPPQEMVGKAKVLDQRTPYISMPERMDVKNLANTPMEAVEKLRSEHPELQIELGKNNILVKKPEEKDFKVLDPSKTEWEDLTDIGTDLAKAGAATVGAITGAAAGATGGAAVGTAVAPGPGTAIGGVTGAYGGAVLGATAGEGLVETLKQGLANALGTSKTFHTQPYKKLLSGTLY